MKKTYYFIIPLFLILTVALFAFHAWEKNKFIDRCEKLAMEWIHEQGLDESDVVDYEIVSERRSAEFYDLSKDGNDELVMTIEQTSLPKPGIQGMAGDGRASSLLYFVFEKGYPITFEKIFTASLWDGDIKKEEVLKLGKGFPNLLCVYDGVSEAPGGEETGEVKGHVFMIVGKAMREVLVYNSFCFVRQAPPGYTSKISVGENRDLVVDYSIPIRSKSYVFDVIGEKHKRVVYEWDERLDKYILRKGSPKYIEPFFNEK